MNVNKRLKIAGFFLSLSEWDRHVEVIRQIMNSLEDFEPYAAFLRITKGKQNYIQASNISEFLRENGIRVEERLLGMIVRLYDTSFENRLNFGDFLRMVLTRDNPDMRFESALRPNYDVVGSENKLQEEIEYTLARFFKKASEFLEKLTNDSDTQRLIEERSIFQEVDSTGSKRIDFVNLKAFFETSKIVPRDSEIISILRVIDINDDGIIFEEELDYFVDLFTRRDPSEATLRKLRMIKRTETSTTTQNPGLRSKVIKSVVVEEIPSSRFSNYTPKRSDNVARTPPKPSEQTTTQFASTLPASRPFMHTNTSDLARTQPVAAREYLYQSRDPQAADRHKLSSTLPQEEEAQPAAQREKLTSTYRFEEFVERDTPLAQTNSVSTYTRVTQKPNPTVDGSIRAQNPARSRTPLSSSYRPERDPQVSSTQQPQDQPQPKPVINVDSSSPTHFKRYRTTEPLPADLKQTQPQEHIREARTDLRRPSPVPPRDQVDRDAVTVTHTREYSSRHGHNALERTGRSVAAEDAPARPHRREAADHNYTSNAHRNRTPTQSGLGPEELARRERTPVLVTREVVETRSEPFESSGRYYRSTQVTRTETVETKLLKDLELRLVSSFRCIIDIEKAVESAKQELALRPDYCMKDHFKMVDQEGKGGFNFLDFSNFFKRIKLTLDKSNSLSKLFEEADQDRDGLINLVEFQDLVSPKQKEYKLLLNCRAERGAGAGYDYEKLFTNETKRLIKVVLMALLERIRLSEQTRNETYFTKAEVESLFSLMDKNKDGFIDRSELRDFLIGNNLQSTQKEQEYLFAKFDSDMDTRIKLSDLLEFYAS